MNTSLGEDIAYEDEIIKRTLRNIKKKENILINEYDNLNKFKENNLKDFFPYIQDELEERKKFLLYKKLCKEEQHSAILKLLEYLNLIESKNKELETNKLLLKLSLLEKELIPYKQILM
tara:strand:- start:27100 stop:27456 length:357 start_codon:yes stop_codon:yes gene_type:complete